jgi:NADH:ubiquinone oxidoreductase subunit
MLVKIRYHDYHREIRIECYTDGYIYNDYDEFYLLSAVGFDSAVKGITAAAVSFREIEIITEPPITLYAGRNEKYRILSTKLTSGLLHQIVCCESFFTESDTKIIHIPRGLNIPRTIYKNIQRGYTIPAIPEWAEWLHLRITENELLKELKGNMKAYELRTHENQLDMLISEGVRNKEITIIEGRNEDAATDQQHNGIPQDLWNRTC